MEFWTECLPLFYTDMWKPPRWAAWVKGFHRKPHAGAHLFFNRAFFSEPVIQDFVFKCARVAHCALLNFGNSCGIFHDLDHSYRGRHTVWCRLGPRAWPRGWLCLCWVEGRKLFSRFMLLVFLGARETKGGGYGNCVGPAFNIPDAKRKGLVLKGNNEELFTYWVYPSLLGNLCLFLF